MKKNYISPTVAVVKITASKLLSGSPLLLNEQAGEGTSDVPINYSRGFAFEYED
jgi:hypothetical protein